MATSYTTIPTGMTAAELDEMFAEVMAKGEAAKIAVMHAAIPTFLSAQALEYYAAATAPPDPPPDPPSTQAIVNHGDAVRVVSELGGDVPGSPGAAAVTNSTIDFIQLNA
jgi:hypothetical protein